MINWNPNECWKNQCQFHRLCDSVNQMFSVSLWSVYWYVSLSLIIIILLFSSAYVRSCPYNIKEDVPVCYRREIEIFWSEK